MLDSQILLDGRFSWVYMLKLLWTCFSVHYWKEKVLKNGLIFTIIKGLAIYVRIPNINKVYDRNYVTTYVISYD